MDCCDITLIVIAIIVTISTLEYMISNIVLDIYVLIYKNTLWEDVSRNDYYYDCLIEVIMFGIILGSCVFALFFQFMDEGYWAWMPAAILFLGLGVTGAAFNIKALVDMNTSHCDDAYLNLRNYINNIDQGSYDAHRMIRYGYPYLSNSTDRYDLMAVMEDWNYGICGKDYDTKVIISSVGCIGWLMSLLSPVVGGFLIYFVVIVADDYCC